MALKKKLCELDWLRITSPIGKIHIDYCDEGLHYVKQIEFVSDKLFKPDKNIKVQIIERSNTQNVYNKGQIENLYENWFQSYFTDPHIAMKLPMPKICVASKDGSFRQQAWLTLAREVKAGEVISYGKLASTMLRPGASRAVGSAMSNNPIQIIVPCHRVIKTNGEIGNYAKGCRNSVKQWLLEFEVTLNNEAENMEFQFDVDACLTNEITLVTASDVSSHHNQSDTEKKIKEQRSRIIDAMGKASAKAQKLHNAVTSDVKLKNSNHKVYLLKGKRENGSVVIGLIKVGYKRLFLMTLYGDQHECDPFCILDFYVHESEQRHGYGKKLFDFAIKAENKHPYQVAIDRPSEKFLNFLSKHFGLKNPVYQINKFVVYEKFFSDLDAIRAVERRRSAPIRRTLFLHDRPTSSNRNVSSASSIHSSRMNKSRQHQRKTFKDSPLLFNHSIQQLSRPNSKTNISSSISVGVSSLLNPHKYIGGQSVNQTMTADTSLYRNYSRHSNRVSPQERKDSSNMTSSKTFNGKAMNNIVVMNGGCGNSVSGENILPPLDHPILQNQNASSIEETESKPKSINVGKELEKKLNLDSEGNYIVDNLVRGIADSKQRLGTSWNVFGVPSNFSSVNSKQHNRHMKR